jgi:tetratricopeptide (TPR) repeat protein
MKNLLNVLLLPSLFLLSVFLPAQVTELALMPASGMTSYGNLPISQLNRAHREQLTGQFEVALMTYNSALAWQPDWVPALAARAELLQRLGRDLEAQRDRMQAARQNPNATAFFLAKGRHGLLPFLALYPREWFDAQYDLTLPVGISLTPATMRDYFNDQYESIVNAPDTALAVRALRQKITQNFSAYRQTMEELPRDYNPAVRKILNANMAMLNHDYAAAVNGYTDAALKDGVTWPELYYNRGLGSILLHDYMNGCQDLARAAKADYGPASVMFGSLCNF